jgi:hypothetical protein
MRKNRLVKGLAGAAALAGASQAYGTVIVRPTPANIAGNNPTNTSSATITRNIDVDGNGTNDIQVRYRSFTVSGYQIQQSFAFSNTGQTAAYGPVGSNSQFYCYMLGTGEAVPGANNFGQNATFLSHLATSINGSHYGLTSQWYLGQRGFLGFSFLNASNVLCYGFLELQTNAWTGAGSIGVQFFGLAYENSGAPITTFQVPEPSTLAALAFGGVGLAAAAYRRRKKA